MDRGYTSECIERAYNIDLSTPRFNLFKTEGDTVPETASLLWGRRLRFMRTSLQRLPLLLLEQQALGRYLQACFVAPREGGFCHVSLISTFC